MYGPDSLCRTGRGNATCLCEILYCSLSQRSSSLLQSLFPDLDYIEGQTHGEKESSVVLSHKGPIKDDFTGEISMKKKVTSR